MERNGTQTGGDQPPQSDDSPGIGPVSYGPGGSVQWWPVAVGAVLTAAAFLFVAVTSKRHLLVYLFGALASGGLAAALGGDTRDEVGESIMSIFLGTIGGFLAVQVGQATVGLPPGTGGRVPFLMLWSLGLLAFGGVVGLVVRWASKRREPSEVDFLDD